MRRLEALGYLWPGLPRLWRHGSVSALIVALGFAVLLNLVLLTTYVQPGLIPDTLRVVLWWALVLGWTSSQWRHALRGSESELSSLPAVGDEGLFLQAQAEYLRGHWYEAESLLETLLRSTPSDVDARLLLVSVLRRSGRADDARRELRGLAETSGASKWRLEIERERALLEPAASEDGCDASQRPPSGDSRSLAA